MGLSKGVDLTKDKEGSQRGKEIDVSLEIMSLWLWLVLVHCGFPLAMLTIDRPLTKVVFHAT